MNQTESMVCARLKQFRGHLRLSQAQFASEIGISRDVLASVEYGRAPLRYDLARRICSQFDLNEGWLAIGTGNPIGQVGISDELEKKIPLRILFTKAFHQYLWPQFSTLQKRMIEEGGIPGVKVQFAPPGLPKDRMHEWFLWQELREAIKGIPIQLRPKFSQFLMRAIDEFCDKQALKRRRSGYLKPENWPANRPVTIKLSDPSMPPNISNEWKKDLTTTSEFRKPSKEMKEVTLKGLLVDIKRLTEEPGTKARLAEYLKVPQARVSEWLSGKHDPSGAIALEMLNWVRRQKRTK